MNSYLANAAIETTEDPGSQLTPAEGKSKNSSISFVKLKKYDQIILNAI